MSIRFDGKVAIVTGGASGIGAAAAELFLELGARVAILDRDAELGRRTLARLTAADHAASFHACDVGDLASVQSAVDEAAREHGAIHILAHCAGIQRYGTVISTPESEWDTVMLVNLKSMYLVSRACVPLLQERGGGAIVNTASVQAFASQSGVAAYTASKHAVLGLTRSMAVDLAPTIRVNCVCPGAVDTPMLRSALAGAADPHGTKAIQRHANAAPSFLISFSLPVLSSSRCDEAQARSTPRL